MLKKTTIRFCENDLKSYFHFLNCFYVKNIHRGLAQNWHPSDTGNLFWKWKIYHKWPHFLVMFYEIKRKSETSTKHPSKTWVKLHQTLPKIGEFYLHSQKIRENGIYHNPHRNYTLLMCLVYSLIVSKKTLKFPLPPLKFSAFLQ